MSIEWIKKISRVGKKKKKGTKNKPTYPSGDCWGSACDARPYFRAASYMAPWDGDYCYRVVTVSWWHYVMLKDGANLIRNPACSRAGNQPAQTTSRWLGAASEGEKVPKVRTVVPRTPVCVAAPPLILQAWLSITIFIYWPFLKWHLSGWNVPYINTDEWVQIPCR